MQKISEMSHTVAQRAQEQLKVIQGHMANLQTQFVEHTKSMNAKANEQLAAVKEKYQNLTPGQKKAVIGVGVVAGAYVSYRSLAIAYSGLSHARRERQLKAMEADGKVHLLMYPRAPWAPSLSPPCAKVETFLRLAKIPYVVEETFNTDGSPNACVPFIVYQGQRIADSQRIIEFLSNEFHVFMDGKLSREDRAVGIATLSTIEYSIFPTLIRTAVIEHPAIAASVIAKAAKVPYILARVQVRAKAAQLRHSLALTATGHLTTEQHDSEFSRDCEAIAQQIGHKKFLFGDTATTYDCAVYAVLLPLASFAQYKGVRAASLAVSRNATLVDYLDRISRLAFPDLEATLAITATAREKLEGTGSSPNV